MDLVYTSTFDNQSMGIFCVSKLGGGSVWFYLTIPLKKIKNLPRGILSRNYCFRTLRPKVIRNSQNVQLIYIFGHWAKVCPTLVTGALIASGVIAPWTPILVNYCPIFTHSTHPQVTARPNVPPESRRSSYAYGSDFD